jgi:hypothetical protein
MAASQVEFTNASTYVEYLRYTYRLDTTVLGDITSYLY